MPSDHELMRVAGDPDVLHVAWCDLRPEAKLKERDEAKRSVKQTLIDHVLRKVLIVENVTQLQADVVVLTRVELALMMRRVWAAAALQGAVTCGSGCSCLTVCGDYYDHASLPKPEIGIGYDTSSPQA